MVARNAGVIHQFEVAEAAAKIILSSSVNMPTFAYTARAGLALIAVQRGDVTAAAEQYAALEFVRGTMFVYIGFDRVLGLLALTLGRLDEAMAHFEDALTFCRRTGYRPESAWSTCDYADALLHRNGPGDHSRAMSLLEEALATARELGMRPLMERVLARKKLISA